MCLQFFPLKLPLLKLNIRLKKEEKDVTFTMRKSPCKMIDNVF